jgi:hypothetical protein
LRFNSADSAYLNRTPSSAGNRKTWTWSAWVKRTGPATPANAVIPLFGATNAANDSGFFVIGVLDSGISIQTWNTVFRRTTTVYRDYSAWYHIVVAFDTTQATAANRLKLYVNNVEETSFSLSTDPTQNTDYPINNNIAHNIFNDGFGSYLSGYLTEVNFVDGQALTPTSFGETDPDTGVWRPKYYTGAYGTNGFYLNFSDNSAVTATTLGKDYSGNSNNWTANNFSVAAGAGNDSVVDSPTSYGTDTGVGGEVRGNYCTLNPLKNSGTLTNGNLDFVVVSGDSSRTIFSTFGVSSGKWYFEMTVGSAQNSYYPGIGVNTDLGLPTTSQSGDTAAGYMYLANGQKYNGGSLTGYGSAFTTSGTVVGVALNMDTGTITFYVNGVSQGQAFSGITGTAVPVIVGNTSASGSVNFGQRAFAYTAPSGFKALCSQNLPTPAIGATSTTQANRYMDVVVRNGLPNGSITSLNFKPDFLWNKSRSQAGDNYVFDSVRGIANVLRTNSTTSETSAPTWYTSFNSNGYSIGSGDWAASVSVVDWVWNAGGTTVTNTAGSISAQVRANTTAGFSIVSYTGGATNATVGHGLGVAPAFIITKSRTSGSAAWAIYHSALGKDQVMVFTTEAVITSVPNYWGTSSPSSTVFGVANGGYANNLDSMIAYCWAEVAGYSRFGSYTGNGSADGPFVYCGFRPRWIMFKRTTAAENWTIFDTARDTYNIAGRRLHPSLSSAETDDTAGTTIIADILSNGFKVKGTGVNINGSGDTYIFAAFAETPFKYARAR